MPQRGRRGRPRPQVIHENLEIESGMITTVHNITGTQPMVDMPNVKKKDLRPRWLKTWAAAAAPPPLRPGLPPPLVGRGLRLPWRPPGLSEDAAPTARPVAPTARAASPHPQSSA